MSETLGLTALERAWAILTPPNGPQFSSFPLDPAFGGLQCRVALDQRGLRHLLIPASGEQLAADSRVSALTVAVHASLKFGAIRGAFVDVRCSEPELNAEFDNVIRDVLDEVEGAEQPGATALRTIGRWRRLFRSRSATSLGPLARRGLFAELTVLRALLSVAPATSMEVWKGPERQPHDFEAGRRCIEVKAIGVESEFVTIHGIDQLAQHDGRPLDLAVLTVVDDPDGVTLSSLVEEVRQLAQSKSTFDSLLAKTGWIQKAAELDLERLTVHKTVRLAVDESTPKLVPASLLLGGLPDAVSEVTYRLALDAILQRSVAVTHRQIAEDAL